MTGRVESRTEYVSTSDKGISVLVHSSLTEKTCLYQHVTNTMQRIPCSRFRRRPIVIRKIDTDIIQHIRPFPRARILDLHGSYNTDNDIGEHEEDAAQLKEIVEL